MTRRFNKTTLGEALEIFGFEIDDEISRKIVMRRFRKLALKHHPDKGGSAKMLSKVVEAKQVLIQDLKKHRESKDARRQSTHKANADFLNFIKKVKPKVNHNSNPFTTYQR